MSIFKSFYFWIAVLAVAIAAIISFTAGRLTFAPAIKLTPSPSPSPLLKSVFTRQSAEIMGKITKINGSSITVQNNQGVSGEFKLPNTIFITKYDGRGKNKSSTNPSDLELNRDVTIYLDLAQDYNQQPAYKINSVVFLPPIPQLDQKPASP